MVRYIAIILTDFRDLQLDEATAFSLLRAILCSVAASTVFFRFMISPADVCCFFHYWLFVGFNG